MVGLAQVCTRAMMIADRRLERMVSMTWRRRIITPTARNDEDDNDDASSRDSAAFGSLLVDWTGRAVGRSSSPSGGAAAAAAWAATDMAVELDALEV